MGSILEKIGQLLNQKQLTDEQLLNETAKREARGGSSSEKQAEAVADALGRLNKSGQYLADKIELVKQHDAAVAAEAAHHLRAEEVRTLRAKYSTIEAELAPIQKRLAELAAILLPKEQQASYDQSVLVGTAARLKAGNPTLFADAK